MTILPFHPDVLAMEFVLGGKDPKLQVAFDGAIPLQVLIDLAKDIPNL